MLARNVGLGAALLGVIGAGVAADPPSCEAPLSGVDYPAYEFSDVIVGCLGGTCYKPNIPGTPDYNPAIAAGAINATEVPYCEARCINPHAAEEQIRRLAVPCRSFCSGGEARTAAAAGTIENLGWCLYWCVAGRQEAIATLSCADRVAYHYQTVTVGTDVQTVALLGTAEYTDIGNAASTPSGSPAPSPTQPASPTTTATRQMLFPPSFTLTQASAASGSSPWGALLGTTAAAGTSVAASTSRSHGRRAAVPGGSIAALVVGLLARLV